MRDFNVKILRVRDKVKEFIKAYNVRGSPVHMTLIPII